MARYHVKADGSMGVCTAQEGHCPYGGEGEGTRHFTSKSEAQAYSEKAVVSAMKNSGGLRSGGLRKSSAQSAATPTTGRPTTRAEVESRCLAMTDKALQDEIEYVQKPNVRYLNSAKELNDLSKKYSHLAGSTKLNAMADDLQSSIKRRERSGQFVESDIMRDRVARDLRSKATKIEEYREGELSRMPSVTASQANSSASKFSTAVINKLKMSKNPNATDVRRVVEASMAEASSQKFDHKQTMDYVAKQLRGMKGGGSGPGSIKARTARLFEEQANATTSTPQPSKTQQFASGVISNLKNNPNASAADVRRVVEASMEEATAKGFGHEETMSFVAKQLRGMKGGGRGPGSIKARTARLFEAELSDAA